MPFVHSKTTFVRPLCESNNNGNVYKSLITPIQQFTAPANVNSPGVHNKLDDNLKHMTEMKSKQLNNINSVHSKLFAEVEEIQKWKTTVEMESRQKNKKVEELMQTIESQRKVVLDLQLQNENLSYRLSEEMQQRSFVIENLHSTKELCSALKKHYNSLQGQFDYRNKIEELINVADIKRMRAIEVLENKFEKVCIEHSERVGYLNDTLATETNKALNLKEALEQEVALYDSEKQSLCTLLSNSQLEIEKLSKEMEEEINKSRVLFQEKRELEMNILKLEKLNDTQMSTIKEMEINLKGVEEHKLEMEKKYFSENLQNKEIKQKYEECLETAKCFKIESEGNILALKQTIENLESKYSDLLKRMEEEKQRNEALSSSLENAEKDKSNLDKVILDANSELNLLKKLKDDYEDLKEKLSQVLEEKEGICIDLENTKKELFKSKSENESAENIHKEKYEELIKLTEDYEAKVMFKEKELTSIKENNSELQLKYKSLEEDILAKSELVIIKDKEIANLQILLAESEKVLENLRNDNVVLKESLEVERTSNKICLECESLRNKVDELETIKASLKKTEEELSMQKRETIDTFRMLNESEKLYNGDRITKEKEIIGYKNQIRQMENEMRLKYVEREIFNNLNSENTKLKNDLEEMEMKLKNLDCTNLSPDKKAAKKDKSYKHKKVSNKVNNKVQVARKSELTKMANTVDKNKVQVTRKYKEITKELAEKFRNKIKAQNLNSTDDDSTNLKKSILENPGTEKQGEKNSSSSDNCFEKFTTNESEKENKVWEVESSSSGSEYLDMSVYRETANQNVFSPRAQNTGKIPVRSPQQKRDIHDTFVENSLAKRPCGGTPQGPTFKAKPQFKSSIWTNGLKTPERTSQNTFIAENHMNKKNTPSTPITTPQRRFFKTPLAKRADTFKKPKEPWF